MRYTVQPADTLWSIAQRFGTTWQELQRLNPNIKDPNHIAVNQVLEVPGSPASGPGGPAPQPSNNGMPVEFQAIYERLGRIEDELSNRTKRESSVPDALNPSVYPVRYSQGLAALINAAWIYFVGPEELPTELTVTIAALIQAVTAIVAGATLPGKKEVEQARPVPGPRGNGGVSFRR